MTMNGRRLAMNDFISRPLCVFPQVVTVLKKSPMLPPVFYSPVLYSTTLFDQNELRKGIEEQPVLTFLFPCSFPPIQCTDLSFLSIQFLPKPVLFELQSHLLRQSSCASLRILVGSKSSSSRSKLNLQQCPFDKI